MILIHLYDKDVKICYQSNNSFFFFYQKMNRWEKPVTLAQDEPINLNEF